MMTVVRGWTKTLMWIAILLACAGVGAYVAHEYPDLLVRDQPHSDPPSGSGPSPGSKEPTRWTLLMTSRTSHTYRVGGSCVSDWRMATSIRVSESGPVLGRGVARLRPGAGCDFPSAQLQTKRVRLRLVGRREGDALVLRFRVSDVAPAGSQDLGGFVKTVGALRLSLPERAGAKVSRSARVEEPEDDVYTTVTVVRLSR
jgi:hypothetical protein